MWGTKKIARDVSGVKINFKGEFNCNVITYGENLQIKSLGSFHMFSEGLGQCMKTEVRFELKDNIRPVFKAKRNVPFLALDAVNQELEYLEKMEVISKVDNSDWAAPTVYVKKKNKKIRVCANFSTRLNDSLKKHIYPLPSPEDIFSKLNGGKAFSKIDLSKAYLQVKVDKECSKLLAINTHKGIFKLNHFPFGLKMTSC